jgi:hypothetical protein
MQSWPKFVARRGLYYVNPFFILVVSFAVFWIASHVGRSLRKNSRELEENSRDDFKFVLGGTLTLLGLIIGFTVSMAVGRYDQRKNYEAEEANAIGTEYFRAELLPSADAATVRRLLAEYVAQRVENYHSREENALRKIEVRTAQLQTRLWSAVTGPANAQPTPVRALAVSGMNDVLNSEGYTTAAWRNRVPIEAWILLGTISVFCNLLVGYGAQGRSPYLLLILPAVLSISLFLIADIDTPRRGFIHVRSLNLESLAESFR